MASLRTSVPQKLKVWEKMEGYKEVTWNSTLMNAINKTTASIAAAITCVGVSYLLSKNNPNNQYPHKHWHQHPQQNFFFKGSLDLCILYWHGTRVATFFFTFIYFLDIIYNMIALSTCCSCHLRRHRPRAARFVSQHATERP